MRLHPILHFATLAAVLSACVTINVYFPAAAAEKAADKIINDVWGGSGSSEAAPSDKSGTPGSSSSPQTSNELPLSERMLLAAAGNILDFLIVPANAQQPDLNVSTPAIRQLTASMEARHATLKKYYDSGAIGLTQTGTIDIHDLNAVPLPERGAVRQLVAEENSDRNNLYREIATANKHPEWEADIRKTFAQRWIDRAAPGWYFQDASGGWKKK